MRLKSLLEKRMKSEAENPAFISGEHEITAEEFLKMVQYIDTEFQNRSFQKSDRLLILSKKSIPVIAGIFCCLFKGYVFVPVDSETPEERLRFIIDDCKPSGILVDQANLERLGLDFFKEFSELLLFTFDDVGNQDSVIKIDVDEVKSQDSSGLIPAGLKDEDDAYIIYTSGSTGTPKGVLVSRAALGSFIESSIDKAGYSGGIRFLNFFPLHFDPVLMEIIMPWVVGGTTILFNKFLYINDLVKALQKYRITDFSCTPNIISMLVSRISHYYKYDWSFLRSIWFGGETANINDIKRFCEITPHVTLFNGYGPTETVVACSLHRLRQEDLDSDILPIGTPMNEVVFKIVNEGQEVMEDGRIGELIVGGAQLMDGYWGKLGDLDKNNFMIFNDRKYYKTSDNVYKKDGFYYFVGRNSTMIKFRGYRIFPSEIENALNSLEEITNSCVFFDEKNHQLVGIVEINHAIGNEEEITDRITAKLRTKLPAYMIPERMVYEENLPRMTTGKLDIQKIKHMLEV